MFKNWTFKFSNNDQNHPATQELQEKKREKKRKMYHVERSAKKWWNTCKIFKHHSISKINEWPKIKKRNKNQMTADVQKCS